MSNAIIYADHSASTPVHRDVIRTMMEVTEQIYANPSSIHEMGGGAEQLVKRAREVIARALQVEPGEIIFTSGATESNNLAVFGTVRAAMQGGKQVHAIVSQVEHASVYACYEQLEREGVAVTYLPVDSNGCVRPEDVAQAIRPETVLLSVMHVNNETGAVQPLKELGAIVKKHPKVSFHVDGVQGLGKLPVELREWNVDFYSLSGHKIGGPKGNGVLVRRGRAPLQPILFGGSQEHGFRAGTTNVPGVVALAKSIRMAAESQPANADKLDELYKRLMERILEIPELVVNSSNAEGDHPAEHGPHQASHIINISFPGMKTEIVVHALENHGVIISTQSACSSKLHKPSRVLLAMTGNERIANSGLRISLSPEMSLQDMDRIGDALLAVVNQLKPLVK